MTIGCVSFIERIVYQMAIEPTDGHCATEIVNGLNSGRYKIRGDKCAVIDAATSKVVAYIGVYEATAAALMRCEFIEVAE